MSLPTAEYANLRQTSLRRGIKPDFANKLFFANNFKDDVKQSVNYIKHILQAPVAAEKLKTEIKRTYKIIKDTPFIYPVVPNDYLASIGFRFTMIKNYMLFYIVEKNQINIIRFLYGYRDWINILNNTNIIED